MSASQRRAVDKTTGWKPILQTVPYRRDATLKIRPFVIFEIFCVKISSFLSGVKLHY
jgi:hypothetical protein